MSRFERAGKSRRFAGIAAGAALAGSLLAAHGCSRPAVDAATAVRQSDLRFLPKETVGLAVVEVARFEDRAAIGRWLDDFAKQSGTGGLERVRAALGPDALEKLDRLALALVPSQGKTQYAVLAEGRFEEQTVKNLTGGAGIVTLVEVGDAPDLSIMPLPQNHLALGPRAVLEQVKTLSGGAGAGQAGLAEAPVMRILSRVSPAKQIWGGIDYSLLSGLIEEGTRDDGATAMAGFARSLRALAFQGAIDDEVQFDLIGLADGEPGAKTLADAARGLVAIARVGASQGASRAAEGSSGEADPSVEAAKAWMRFLDGVRIDQERDEIRVHGTLDGTMAKSFAGAASRAVPGVGTN